MPPAATRSGVLRITRASEQDRDVRLQHRWLDHPRDQRVAIGPGDDRWTSGGRRSRYGRSRAPGPRAEEHDESNREQPHQIGHPLAGARLDRLCCNEATGSAPDATIRSASPSHHAASLGVYSACSASERWTTGSRVSIDGSSDPSAASTRGHGTDAGSRCTASSAVTFCSQACRARHVAGRPRSPSRRHAGQWSRLAHEGHPPAHGGPLPGRPGLARAGQRSVPSAPAMSVDATMDIAPETAPQMPATSGNRRGQTHP
jgi:hypothetical protein